MLGRIFGRSFSTTSAAADIKMILANKPFTLFTDGGGGGRNKYGNPIPAGYGYVLISRGGEIVLGGGGRDNCISSMEAEMRGLLLGLQRSNTHPLVIPRELQVVCDLESLVNQLKSGQNITGSPMNSRVHANLLADIRYESSLFSRVDYTQKGRDLNKLADIIATFGRKKQGPRYFTISSDLSFKNSQWAKVFENQVKLYGLTTKYI